ncbi:AbrB family transcriptional regulator [Nitratireductor kimnyeongensis]|uniref:AbrB family transcriptional regulator n=1 Tax=Nitratireductor kimnyeongensis TaxID=430679 RepID=A0ABW0T7P9_9HYPH|nr:AbrB family transcriptional regulator [Nitratireductor kimnyeongensis]QZZ36127.1 AbrB family transcriptional regulator [Nitratireductor kimnyeongensis]
MDSTPPPSFEGPLTRLVPVAQWPVLLAFTVGFAGLMLFGELPAALLIGPMLAAVLAGVLGAKIRVPGLAFACAQALVGLLIGGSLEPEILASFADIWPILILAVVTTVSASSLLGFLVSRWKILPGTTAVWGSAPGAATAMVLMAGAFGADQRLVAFMQYLRVIFVTVAAAFIARFWVDVSSVDAPGIVWFPPVNGEGLFITALLMVAGAIVGRVLRFPSPYFLGGLLVGALAHLGGGLALELPPWLMGAAYLTVGWSIGLKFDRPLLATAMKAMPQVVLSIVALMLFCGGLAWFLHVEWGIDPLTAYLATSPGGMDSVAIIAAAASQNVNLSFIMAVQMARFLFVLLAGPPISRMVARWAGP